MAKYIVTTPTPLDDAVAAFLSRVVESGHPKNYITRYTFDRSAGDLSTITVTFAADEELHKFGQPVTVEDIKRMQEAIETEPNMTEKASFYRPDNQFCCWVTDPCENHKHFADPKQYDYPTRPVRDNPQA